jgi:hypothetical protein
MLKMGGRYFLGLYTRLPKINHYENYLFSTKIRSFITPFYNPRL